MLVSAAGCCAWRWCRCLHLWCFLSAGLQNKAVINCVKLYTHTCKSLIYFCCLVFFFCNTSVNFATFFRTKIFFFLNWCDLFSLSLAQILYLCNTCFVVSWQALKFTAGASRDVNFIDMAESDSLLWGSRIRAFVCRTDGWHHTMQAHQEKDPPQSVSHGYMETRSELINVTFCHTGHQTADL